VPSASVTRPAITPPRVSGTSTRSTTCPGASSTIRPADGAMNGADSSSGIGWIS